MTGWAPRIGPACAGLSSCCLGLGQSGWRTFPCLSVSQEGLTAPPLRGARARPQEGVRRSLTSGPVRPSSSLRLTGEAHRTTVRRARRSPTSGPGPLFHTEIRGAGQTLHDVPFRISHGGPRSRPTRRRHASSPSCTLSLRRPLLRPGHRRLGQSRQRTPVLGRTSRPTPKGRSQLQGLSPTTARDSVPAGPGRTTRGSAPQARGTTPHNTPLRGRARIFARLQQWAGRVPPYLYFVRGSVRRTHCSRGSACSRGPRSPHQPRGRLRFKQPQRSRCINSHSAPASVDHRTSRGDRECGAELGMAVYTGG
ncbi:hypothetical protein NDU88_010020 [Pleurodeles waltl]|uniref:Uncharacterized protein n=1 Tax=Pleurodeles waltl TaxID=8319 RepID=A0AAV7RZB1_PLEWA|nr:hypothetical protein NDU88_010020 [Pleurodeles waltl]